MQTVTSPLPALGLAALTACEINVDLGHLPMTDPDASSGVPTGTSETSGAPLLCGDGSGGADDRTYFTSCNAIKSACPGSISGEYLIDSDGDGDVTALMVHCEMELDDCGYTMLRLVDGALGPFQVAYSSKCAGVGMEVIVPRTKALAGAIYTWNDNVAANLYNVYPKYAGSPGIGNWRGICKGKPCTFWMTDNADGNVICDPQLFQPDGDNDINYRIYRENDGCGPEGGWNDDYDHVKYQGWVICSTNDC